MAGFVRSLVFYSPKEATRHTHTRSHTVVNSIFYNPNIIGQIQRHMYFLSSAHRGVIKPPFIPVGPHLSSSTTCALPPSLSSLPLHLTQSLPSLFLRSPNTTCWAAAWRAWGAAQRPPAPTALRTPPRRPCPPLRPTPSPTLRLRAFRLPRPSPPTLTTLDCTPSRCPSNNPAPPSLQHGPWVN